MREVRLELLRPDQIVAEKERCAIAYLPIGPLEWHGPAAPFGTDPLTAHESAVRCAREVGGVVLPPLFMGVDTPRDEQGLQNLGFENTDQYIVGMDFPDNTVPSYYFREEVFAMAVREYVRLLVKQGYRLIVLINGHGAINQMGVCQRIAAEFRGEGAGNVLVGFPSGGGLGFEGEDPGHATRCELSLMMVLTDSVDLSKLPPKGEPIPMWKYGMADGSGFMGEHFAKYGDYNVHDDPREGGSAELGERYLAAGVAALVAQVRAAWEQIDR